MHSGRDLPGVPCWMKIARLESGSTKGHTISQTSVSFFSFKFPQVLERGGVVSVGLSLGGRIRSWNC